jgi:hypothetical protein
VYFAALIPISLIVNSSRQSMAAALGTCDKLLGAAEENYAGTISEGVVQEVATLLFDAVRSTHNALRYVA